MITTIELSNADRLKIEPKYNNPFTAFYIEIVDKDGKRISSGTLSKLEAKDLSKLLS